MELFRKKIKNVDSNWYSRIGRYFGYLGLILGIAGCGTIKKAGVVATGAAVGATAGSVLSGGAIAPIVGSMGGAFVTDVATAAMGSSRTTMADGSCAPDNFWTLLGSMAEMGGWLLILVVIIPMVLGWFLPGPVKMKGREPKHNNPYIR